MDATQRDIDDLVESMLNYYFLVQCGVIQDKLVTPRFLDAVREISKKGVYILEY